MRGKLNVISIVVPVHNEAENIPVLHERVRSALADEATCEIIFVDDGSTDGSLKIIKDHAAKDRHVHYVSLARNFGHQAALKIGLEKAEGDVVVTMDADLQHPPECIAQMIAAWRGGAQVVNMVRRHENTSVFKRWSSRLFYRVINSISDYHVEFGSSDFRLLDREVVDTIRSIPEKSLFLRGLIPWLGYRQHHLSYKLADRHAGSTKYGLRKMIRLALNGITSSSLRPLHLSTLIGTVIAMFATLYAIYAICVRIFLGTAMPGWASLLAGIMLLGGVQLLMLGILGEYLGRILIEVKGRPSSIVRESDLDS